MLQRTVAWIFRPAAAEGEIRGHFSRHQLDSKGAPELANCADECAGHAARDPS